MNNPGRIIVLYRGVAGVLFSIFGLYLLLFKYDTGHNSRALQVIGILVVLLVIGTTVYITRRDLTRSVPGRTGQS